MNSHAEGFRETHRGVSLATPVTSVTPRWHDAPFVALRPGGDPSKRGTIAVTHSGGVRSAAALADFGELAGPMSDPAVTDVFVNGSAQVWVDRGGGLEASTPLSLDEAGLRDLAVRLIGIGGRHIDEASPCVDVRLHGGIRVHAVLPPISTGGTLLSIRLPRVRRLGLADLDAAGFFGAAGLGLVSRLVADRRNLLITGAAGSGNTTWNL